MDDTVLRESLEEARQHLETLRMSLEAGTTPDRDRNLCALEATITLRYIWAVVHVLADDAPLNAEDIAWAEGEARRLGWKLPPTPCLDTTPRQC